MNQKSKDLYLMILYGLCFIGVLMVLFTNIKFLWSNLLISLCYILSFTLRHLFINKTEYKKVFFSLTYVIDGLLLIILCSNGVYDGTKLLFLISATDCFVTFGPILGIPGFLLAFSFYNLSRYLHTDLSAPQLLKSIGSEFPIFLFVGLISFLLGSVLESNRLVEKTMNEIALREAELKAAYEALDIANQKTEELATLKERNRIAHEIHDTVGHTVTNVIVEMEAGRMLYKKDPLKAMEKYAMAQLQAAKALEELRGSVRFMATTKEEPDFVETVKTVLEEAELHTGITVKKDIQLLNLPNTAYSELLIRIIKEGISNGIRHGKATAFFLKLQEQNNQLLLLLQDNGKGCKTYIPGFGLTQMRKSIEKSGGTLLITPEEDEGFELMVKLPLERG